MEYTVGSEKDNTRLDIYVSEKEEKVSRAYISKLISEGKITCNSKPRKPSYRVRTGDVVSVVIPPPKTHEAKPWDTPLDIVYDDEYLAVINKPAGMVVHPAPGHKDKTLVNALIHHFRESLSDINGVVRPGIVHRIDKDTSGLLLVVKKNEVHKNIAEAIRKHEIKRTYRALVLGKIHETQGTVDMPLARNPSDRLKNAVIRTGKHAVTHFKVLERYLISDITYVEVYLETGRTHQIRVHFSHIGHPVLGDSVYGGKNHPIKTQNMFLHAYELKFLHPVTKNVIIARGEMPDYFNEELKGLGLLKKE